MTFDPIESQLYDEQFDIEWELYTKLQTLIDAEWDSNTLKKKIEVLLKQYDKVRHELHTYQDKKEASKI